MDDVTITVLPLGDRAILLRFAETLDDQANYAVIGLARALMDNIPVGVNEVVPNLVSISVHYDPDIVGFDELAGQLRLIVVKRSEQETAPKPRAIPVAYGGQDGPDLENVAQLLSLPTEDFIAAHTKEPLRVLATGFAPGFVYCGMHPKALELPRRQKIRRSVPPGTVLFAAGRTAITSTSIPTGWHVIGRTNFVNFLPDKIPATKLSAGDVVAFEVAR